MYRYMQIIWYGQSCFQITSQKGKNNLVNIIINPPNKETGLKTPKIGADILLVGHNPNHKNIKAVNGDFFLVDGPGEYEIKEVYINGISGFINNPEEIEENTETIIYTIEIEGMRICHLGNFEQKELNEEQVEKIGDIDILMVPVSENAKKIISQIEPKTIIPMQYKIPELKEKAGDLEEFLKLMGIKSTESLQKLSIKKKDVLGNEAKIIILKP